MGEPKAGGHHDGHGRYDNYAAVHFYTQDPRLASHAMLTVLFRVDELESLGGYGAYVHDVMVSQRLRLTMEGLAARHLLGYLGWWPSILDSNYGGFGLHHAGPDGKAQQEAFLQGVKTGMVAFIVNDMQRVLNGHVWVQIRTNGCHETFEELDFPVRKAA